MRYRLSLSGEIPRPEIMAMFDGIGLIRSEYVLRAQGRFITHPDGLRRLSQYLADVSRCCPSGEIWYRTTEFTSQEANTLDGVDRVFNEADFMKGRRGVRRALELPHAFETELRLLAEVAQDVDNLHVLIPFVRDAADFSFAVDMLERVGWPNRFGTMIEIPSALLDAKTMISMGADNLLLGMNDLSSLLTGTSRQDQDMKLHPSVAWAVETIKDAVGPENQWGIAGNLSKEVLRHYEQSGIPYSTLHYNELPQLLGISPTDLPEIDFVKRTKEFTRSQIAAFEDRLKVEH